MLINCNRINFLNYKGLGMPSSRRRVLRWIFLGSLLVALAGCAVGKFPPTDLRDPYEHFNRKVFAFNMAVDRAFFRPVAKVYKAVIPWPLRKGVRNFFSNINDVTSVANEILQLHFSQVAINLARIAINTTLGIGGLFDVAARFGLAKDREDFGLTLAMWGSRDTPYIVLPFLGPKTIRDAIAMPLEYYFLSIWPYIENDTIRLSLRATNYVQRRSVLLVGDKVIEQAFDPYIFVRDAYLQRRSYMVKESEEEHVTRYVDKNGIVHRHRRSIPVESVLSD